MRKMKAHSWSSPSLFSVSYKGRYYHQRDREQYYPECEQFEIPLVGLERNGRGHYSCVSCDVPAHDEIAPTSAITLPKAAITPDMMP